MVRSLVGALVEVGTGRRDVAWLEEVTAAAVRAPAIPVLAAGWADPGGGRLSRRRGAGRAGPAGPDAADAGGHDVHYFSADPGGPERRRTITANSGVRSRAGHRRRRLRRRGVGPGNGRAAARVADADRSTADPGPRLRLRADCAGHRPALSRSDGRRGRREPAGAGPVPRQCRGRRRRRPGPGAASGGGRPATRYDEIWSNPPIRIGKEALHALLLDWLPRLRPAGVARLVVCKNLGADTLQRWLADQGYAVERAASAKGFRVLVVRRARSEALLSPSDRT